jgi:hypothetical protein
MLPATAVSLAVLAALLAWPVPARLARARWPRRDPLVALVCWQAIGLAGGLSMIGALLVHGLAPWGHSLLEAVWSVLTLHPAGDSPSRAVRPGRGWSGCWSRRPRCLLLPDGRHGVGRAPVLLLPTALLLLPAL